MANIAFIKYTEEIIFEISLSFVLLAIESIAKIEKPHSVNIKNIWIKINPKDNKPKE